MSKFILSRSEVVIDKHCHDWMTTKVTDIQAKDKLQLTWWEGYIKLYIRRCKIECFHIIFIFSANEYKS